MKVRILYPEQLVEDLEWSGKTNYKINAIKEYLVPNAYVNYLGYIFKNFRVLKKVILPGPKNQISWKNVVSAYFLKRKRKTDENVISILSGWHSNFYHFTLECLPKLYVLREHIEKATVVMPENIQPFVREWIKILNLTNITYVKTDEVLVTPLAISCTFTAPDLYHNPAVIPGFRKWITEKIKNKEELSYKRIFIGRKNPKHRKIVNLDEVKFFLQQEGFVYLEMEDYTLEQQIKIFMAADEIVAVHGASLTHLCFAKSGIRVIDLMHKDFYQWCFMKLCRILSIDYSILRCAGDRVDLAPGYDNLIVDIKALSQSLVPLKAPIPE